MAFASVGDIEIYYEIHGPTALDEEVDAPWLLVISGTGNDLRVSQPHRSPLNRAFRVVHYDQRGLGQTTRTDEAPTMATFADDAAGLLTHLGIDRCRVMGTSFGGMVAQHFAIRHGERVDRLVLNCTSPGGALPSFPLHTLTDLPAAERIETTLGLWDSRHVPGSDDPIPGLGNLGVAIRDGLSRTRPPEAQIGFQAQVMARAAHDTNALLSTITAPTLVTAGRFDNQAPMANSEALVAAIPNAELAVFEGGHFFQLQDPQAFVAIEAFLS